MQASVRNHCAGCSGGLWAAAENCTVSSLGTGHLSMFSLFLKESLTFHRPGAKRGEQKCCQTRRGWESLLSGAGKGFLWSIYCHGNSECDLEACLALSQVERFGKKAETQPRSELGGKAAALGTAPEGMRRAPASLGKDGSRRPCKLGWRGQPMSLRPVARLDEHAGNLFNVLDMEGRTEHAIRSFIHSFILQTVLKGLLCWGQCAWHRDDKHSLCLPFGKKAV